MSDAPIPVRGAPPAPRPIEPLAFEQLTPALREQLDPRVRRLGYLGAFFAFGGRQPAALSAFTAYTEALKDALPARLSELVALTVSSWSGNEYEHPQHVALSRKLGFDETWIEAASGSGDLAALDDGDRAVRALVIAMVEPSGDPRPLLQPVVDLLGQDDAMAVLLLVGRYVAHGAVGRALGLQSPVET